MSNTQPIPGASGADHRYEPSQTEANRSREQGLGVGQRDLDAQRDPDLRPTLDPLGSTAEAALDDEGEVSGASTRTNLVGQTGDDIQGRRTLERNREIVRGRQ